MRLGDKLKMLREQSGLLQREVAAILKIDAPMYCKIEASVRKAKRPYLLPLAELFGVREEDLLSLWLADRIVDLLKEERHGLNSLVMAGQNLYPGVFNEKK